MTLSDIDLGYQLSVGLYNIHRNLHIKPIGHLLTTKQKIMATIETLISSTMYLINKTMYKELSLRLKGQS